MKTKFDQNSLTVRDASLVDASNITRLIQILANDEQYQSPLNDGYVSVFLNHPGCGVLLAEWDHRVVGLLSYGIVPNLFHAGDSWSIQELVVEPDFRGKGIGSALLQTILKRAEHQGCMEISISAMPDNQKAIKLYKSLGLTDEAVYLEKHL